MSLTIKVQLITDKQKAVLASLEYYGNINLTCSEAAELIDGLFEQQRLDRVEADNENQYIYETYEEQNGRLAL